MGKTPHTPIERIGIDESGKGDYFGSWSSPPSSSTPPNMSELTLMQVRDSTKISDGRVLDRRLTSGQFVPTA